MKRFALYLGCNIPVRAMHYEASVRAVAGPLGLELVDVPGFGCCGFPLEPVDLVTSVAAAAHQLAVAEEAGLREVCTLCNACTGSLTRARSLLIADSERHDEGEMGEGELGQKVSERLERLGLRVPRGVRIRHFARILYEEVGVERIRRLAGGSLEGLRVAVHYGCHYLRPSDRYGGFEDPERPHTLEELVAATGAEPVDYPGKLDCCGGGLVGLDREVALRVARRKLDNLARVGPDVLVLSCPYCAVMYDRFQQVIGEQAGRRYGLPVLYLSQLLGLALGLEGDVLGLRLNSVSPKPLLERIGKGGW